MIYYRKLWATSWESSLQMVSINPDQLIRFLQLWGEFPSLELKSSTPQGSIRIGKRGKTRLVQFLDAMVPFGGISASHAPKSYAKRLQTRKLVWKDTEVDNLSPQVIVGPQVCRQERHCVRETNAWQWRTNVWVWMTYASSISQERNWTCLPEHIDYSERQSKMISCSELGKLVNPSASRGRSVRPTLLLCTQRP